MEGYTVYILLPMCSRKQQSRVTIHLKGGEQTELNSRQPTLKILSQIDPVTVDNSIILIISSNFLLDLLQISVSITVV